MSRLCPQRAALFALGAPFLWGAQDAAAITNVSISSVDSFAATLANCQFTSGTLTADLTANDTDLGALDYIAPILYDANENVLNFSATPNVFTLSYIFSAVPYTGSTVTFGSNAALPTARPFTLRIHDVTGPTVPVATAIATPVRASVTFDPADFDPVNCGSLPFIETSASDANDRRRDASTRALAETAILQTAGLTLARTRSFITGRARGDRPSARPAVAALGAQALSFGRGAAG